MDKAAAALNVERDRGGASVNFSYLVPRKIKGGTWQDLRAGKSNLFRGNGCNWTLSCAPCFIDVLHSEVRGA